MDNEIYDELYRREDSHWLFRGRRAIIRSVLARAEIASAPRILDAGCGTGRNLLELSQMGEAVGVDSSQVAVDYCSARGLRNVHRAPLEELPFEDGSFDLVVLADVIEHVEDDGAVLSELRRVAATGALMVLTTPAYKWLWGSHDISHHHKRRYTRPELLARTALAGWEPSFATYWNTFLLPPIAAVRLLRREVKSGTDDVSLTPAWLDGPLVTPLLLEGALVRRGFRFPFGVSIGALCRAGSPA